MGSTYFSDDELRCHGENPANYQQYGYTTGCGCGGSLGENGISPDLKRVLDAIREAYGGPLYLSCAYRCPVHNKRVGGEENSYHMQGMAADILVPDGWEVMEFAQLCRDTMRSLSIKGGVGRYYAFAMVHVDVRGYEERWEG